MHRETLDDRIANLIDDLQFRIDHLADSENMEVILNYMVQVLKLLREMQKEAPDAS